MGIEMNAYGQNKPDGSDAQPTKLSLLTTDKFVVIELPKPLRWVNLPPELAIDLGNQLTKWGRRLIKKKFKKPR